MPGSPGPPWAAPAAAITGPGAGYAPRMTPRDEDLDYEDQDSEPTMTAPEEGRPDGLKALKDDDDSDNDSDSSTSGG